ncbi:MAG: hypothetical protein LUG57_05195 [Oscillospiraceae bacterium]|nr:hypothetical protein [Oscillospiraceae bacterium]
MRNQDLRERVNSSGLLHWQLAERIGISENTLCRWLRYELTAERRERVEAALDALTNGEDEEAIKHGGS